MSTYQCARLVLEIQEQIIHSSVPEETSDSLGRQMRSPKYLIIIVTSTLFILQSSRRDYMYPSILSTSFY